MARRRIVTAREQYEMLAPWRVAADNRHPDLAASLATCGCVHTTGGRCLPRYKTAAADFTGPQDVTFNGFDDPKGWSFRSSFAPSQIAQQGARAYSSLAGLPDPHDGSTDYLNARRTPQSVRAVARNYDSLPMHDPNAVKHFDAMRNDVNAQHDFMTNRLGINTQVTDHDPYNDVHEMLDDINNNKRLQVLGTHVTGGHPYLDDATNDKFRAVHDFFGHAATGRSFDRHGEQGAYLAHAQMFSPQARPALATETSGQNSSLILNGKFAPQKTAILHPSLMDTVRHGAWLTASVGDEIYKKIQQSPGGITWSPDGPPPEHGYMVSLPHAEKKIPFENLSPEEIDHYLGEHPEISHEQPYGGWHAAPNWVHDVSKNIPDDYNAKSRAVDWGQDAVFDLDAPKQLHSTEPVDQAYIGTNPWVNSGPASATGWRNARRWLS